MSTRLAALDRPLPAEVAVGEGRWLGYRRFPVFSRPWLLRRLGVFAAPIAAFAVLASVGSGSQSGDWGHAWRGGAMFFLAFLVISHAGPLLATLVRHAGWRLPLERAGVLAAMLLGLAIAYVADQRASAFLIDKGLAQDTVATPAPAEAPTRLANLVLLVAIYATLGGGLALRRYLREPARLAALARERELAALRRSVHESDLRLAVLQAQVEPHFLFNTLASLRLLIRADPDRAEQVLDALVTHLRATIPQLREDGASVATTLGQQIDICAGYLDLMRVRMGERLSVQVEAEPSLRELAFPPLLLITLVENAIKHGIEPKRGAGQVWLRAGSDGERLTVAVEDDGVGLAPGPSSGLGLANVREQLAARFGSRAQLSVDARPGGGTRAVIEVPLEPAG